MRIIPVVLLFIAAGLSTASAQDASTAPAQEAPAVSASSPAPASSSSSPSFEMDHGNAAAAAAASKAAAAAAREKADAIRAGRPLTASQSTDFSVNGGVVRLAPPLTPAQQKAGAEARATWQARCRPAVVTDREGLRRTQYAEPDCDVSRVKAAGGA